MRELQEEVRTRFRQFARLAGSRNSPASRFAPRSSRPSGWATIRSFALGTAKLADLFRRLAAGDEHFVAVHNHDHVLQPDHRYARPIGIDRHAVAIDSPAICESELAAGRKILPLPAPSCAALATSRESSGRNFASSSRYVPD